MHINTLALFVLVAVIFFLFTLIVFIMLRLISSSRRLAAAEEGGGTTAFMASAMQDAVARMRAHERELAARAEASERLSDQIIDSLPSGLLVTGASAEPRRINPAGARMLGLPDATAGAAGAAEMPASGFWEQLGDSGAALRALIDECLATGAGSSRRTIVIDRPSAGGRRHLGVSVAPLRDGSGAVTGAICLFADLTSVVELEDQLRLKDSLARLGELTAGLAHEFRNGLATIHGYARLMNAEKLPPEHRAYVESLRAETDSLTEIVANFLAFARPASQTLLPIALAPIVARAVEESAPDARRHGGTVDASGDFAEVDGDDVMLRQALSNLLRNAVEACAEARTAPLVRVHGAVDRAAGLQRLAVSDNGPGVAAAVGDKVFQPFFTTRGRGTGLGLALVQKIIVSHNGRVTLGASPDGGAEFTIVLPLAAGSK
ncbi:MAG TPA: ATP-binding protein [Vicinamibacterales bacterium]|nr:ATP-binding protein [Vicinamibacterales bacterium]